MKRKCYDIKMEEEKKNIYHCTQVIMHTTLCVTCYIDKLLFLNCFTCLSWSAGNVAQGLKKCHGKRNWINLQKIIPVFNHPFPHKCGMPKPSIRWDIQTRPSSFCTVTILFCIIEWLFFICLLPFLDLFFFTFFIFYN